MIENSTPRPAKKSNIPLVAGLVMVLVASALWAGYSFVPPRVVEQPVVEQVVVRDEAAIQEVVRRARGESDARIAEARQRLETESTARRKVEQDAAIAAAAARQAEAEAEKARLVDAKPAEKFGNARCPHCNRAFVVNPKLKGQIRCPHCSNFIGAQEALNTRDKDDFGPGARAPDIKSPEESYAEERKRIEDKKKLDERYRIINERRMEDQKRDEEERLAREKAENAKNRPRYIEAALKEAHSRTVCGRCGTVGYVTEYFVAPSITSTEKATGPKCYRCLSTDLIDLAPLRKK